MICESELCVAAIQCFQPNIPEKGEISPLPLKVLYSEGEEVFFFCDDGYERNGAGSIVCTNTGDWSDVEPICESKSCVECAL